MGYILSKYKLLCPGIKRVVIATAFFACITFRAEAQQSCYDASQNVIYTNPFLRVGMLSLHLFHIVLFVPRGQQHQLRSINHREPAQYNVPL
jgi:hypothetical protein